MRYISGKLLEFGPLVQAEMSFEDVSYLQLCWLNCSTQRNCLLGIFVEGIMRNISVTLF